MVFESNTISLAKVMDGEQGKTQYIHIMYSNKENPTSSSDISKTPNDYMGVCISTSATAPLSPAEYTWSKIKGEVGEQGIKGDDGKTYYLHIKWSNDGGKTICEGTGSWMGVYTDTSPDALELPEAYQWTRVIGTDGTAIILTNESHTIPCDQNGLNGNYTGAETEVLIFEGSKNTTSTWKITCSPSKGITGSFKNNKYTITKITEQSGYVDFTATKDGFSSLSKRFQISTSKTGADAVINWLLCKTVLHRDNTGKIKDNKIIITSKQQIGNQVTQSYSGRFKVYFDDAVNYTSATDESAKTITVPDSINTIKIELYSSGNSGSLLDQQTVTVVDDGQRGSNGKSYQLSIINPINTIVYDYTGNNPTPSSTGAFTAELYENGDLITSGITYQWSTKSKESIFSGTSTANTFSPTLSKTYTNQSNNSICLIATYNGQSLYAVSDIIVVKNAKPGVSAVNMILSNDSHNIPIVNGAKVYSGAETTVSIYEGTNDVTSGWTIKTELNGITGTFKDNKFTVTALDKDTGYVDFTASKSGYTDVTKRFSLSVSKEGNDGVSYWLSLDNTIIYKKNDGTLSTDDIVMTGYRQIGSNDIVTYGCRYEVYADNQLSYKSTTDEFSHTFKLTSTMKKLQIKMYKSGGLTTLLDEQTVYVLSDGASGTDGYTIYLTNQNETFLSDTNGNIPSDIQSVTKVMAYKGTEKVTPKIGTVPDIPGLSHTTLDDTITFVAVSGTSLADKGSVEIPVLIENKSFIVAYSWIKLANASSDLTSLRTAVNEVKNTTDTLKGEITECVKQTVYDKDQKAIESKFSSTTTTLEGITSEVSSMRTDFGNKIDSNSTKIQQTSDRINLIATGDKESNLEITDRFISLASEKIGIKAMNVNIDALTTFMNTAKDGTTTVISGGAIKTDTVNAMLIAAQLLQSKNYQGPSVVDGIYAQAGLQINMETGAMIAKNFTIDDKGNAYFKGNGEFEGSIIANKGYIGGIGGFTIEAGKLYSGMDSFPDQPTSVSKDKNVYIGTDGIALGGGNFRVDPNGKLYANSGTFSGTIYADGGTIGGWNISANSLSNRDGSISLNPDGLKLGNQLNIDNQGNATFGGKLSAATGSFSGELVAATGSFSGELKAATGTFSGDLKAARGTFEGTLNGANGTFSGELSAATGSFTGTITATSLTLSGCKIDYNTDIENKPDIPSDMTLYIKKDGTIGTLTEEVQNIPVGSKGFKISSDGLLQASNAIIYGTIFANQGTIGGFNITTTADVSHYYTNTLYRITTDGTYYYQAGISSDGTSPTNATFYVRKSNYSNNWENSLVPFFVRNNGSLYAQDATIGTTLNICTDSSKYSSRIPILAYDRKGDTSNYQLTLGLLNSSSRISFDTQSVNFESFYGYEMMSVVSYDGTSAWLWKGDRCKTLDIGTSGRSFDNGYFKKLYLDGTDIETLIKTGSTPTGLKKNKIRIGSSDSGQGMGGGKEYVVYSDSTWSDTLPITCYTIGAASSSHNHDSIYAKISHSHSNSDINWNTTLGYKGFGHCHTVLINSDKNMCVAISNDSVPAFTPYNVTSYTNIDNYTVGAGGTCNLGSTSAPWNKIYASELWLNGKQLTSSGSSGRGIASITSGGTSANGLKITFNSNCQTESTTYDWVQIFYESNGRKIALSKLGGSFGGTTVSIPSTTFWLYWRTDSSNDSFYGFSIDSITPANISSPSLSTTSDSFPSYSVTELSGSNYPESSHGSYGDNINQLWRYTYSGGGTGSYKITLEDGTVYTLNTGSSTPSPSPTVNQATSSTAGIMKLYSSTGSNTDGTMTQAAIKAAIDAIDTSGGGGGTTYYGGTGITISGNTISVDSTASSTHTHDSISNGSKTITVSSGLMCGSTSGCSIGLKTEPWKNGWFTGTVTYGSLERFSDKNVKHDICIYNHRIEQAYMNFQGVSYRYNYYDGYDLGDNIHYGFIAQQIKESLIKNGISSEDSSLVHCTTYDKPNSKGLLKEYSLSYDEFISLNTHMTQKAHHRIDSLESENKSLKNEILMLQGQLSLITQRLQKMEEKLC